MTQSPTKSALDPGKKNSKTWMILAILLLIIVAGLLIFYVPMKSKYEAMLKDKDVQRTILQYELDDLMAAHESIKIQ